MKLVIPKGATSWIVHVFIQANNVTTGAGLSGLVHTSGIVGGYVRAGGVGVALAVDEDVTTEGTYQAPSAAGKVRIGTPANMRAGTYELHFHNDLWATGAESIVITLGGATNMADIAIEIQLSDPVRGLGSPTALPNSAADAAGGIPISDAGGLDLDAKLAATNEVTAARMGALTDLINGGRLDLLIDAIKAVTDLLPNGGALTNLDAAITTRATPAQVATELGTYDAPTKAELDAAVATLATAAALAAVAAYVDTEVAAIKAKTDGLPSDPADHSIIVAATDAILAAVAALNNLSSAQAQTAAAAALTAYDPPTRTEATADKDAVIAAIPTAAAIADAVHDEALAGHATAGSAGKALSDVLADTGTDGVKLDPAQSITLDAGGARTIKQILSAAWAQGAGKWALVGTTLTLYGPDGTTPIFVFTLNSASTPTSRTPA